MADILLGSAHTTPRVRADLQASKETTDRLARQYGLSRTSVPNGGADVRIEPSSDRGIEPWRAVQLPMARPRLSLDTCDRKPNNHVG
jgi:hypothetical protein